MEPPEELVELHRVAGGEGGEAQEQARRQPRPAGRRVGARHQEGEALAGRLASEGEQQRRLGVTLLGERQPRAEDLDEAPALRVAEDGVGPPAAGEPALGEAGEHDVVEAVAAQLEGRDDRDPVACRPAHGHCVAREQLARDGGHFAGVDLFAKYVERPCTTGEVARGGGDRRTEERLGDSGEAVGPRHPRRLRRKGCAGSPQGRDGGREAAGRNRPQLQKRRALDIVVAGERLSGLLLPLTPAPQVSEAERQARGPLIETGDHPSLSRLVEPQRGLARRRRRTERRRDQQVDDGTAGEGPAGLGRETLDEAPQHAGALAAVG